MGGTKKLEAKTQNGGGQRPAERTRLPSLGQGTVKEGDDAPSYRVKLTAYRHLLIWSDKKQIYNT